MKKNYKRICHKVLQSPALLIFIIIGCWSFMAPNVTAQNIDFISKELDHNLMLRALDKEIEYREVNAEQYVWLPNPEFSAGVFPLPVETRLGAQIFRLSVMQMLPNRNIHVQKKMIEGLRATPVKAEKDAKLIALEFQIKEQYLEYYRLSQKKLIIEKNLVLLESLEDLALSKVENNKGRMSDVLMVQVKRQSIREQIKILDQQIAIPLNNINAMVYRSQDAPAIEVINLDFPIWTYDERELIQTWFENHPKSQSFDYQKDILKAETSLEDLSAKPVFGVGLDYIYVDPMNVADPKWNGRDIVQLKASVTIPINRNPYDVRNKARVIKMESLDLQKKQVSHEISRIIRNAKSQFDTAKLNVELSQLQIQTINSTIQILEKAYTAEQASIENLISLEMDLINYETLMLENIVAAYRAINAVENLVL